MHFSEVEEARNRLDREVAAYCVMNPSIPQEEVAKLFGVTRGMVSDICTRQGIVRPKGRKPSAKKETASIG